MQITINGKPLRPFEVTIAEYAKRGLQVRQPSGRGGGYNTMVAIDHDGVQYTVDDNNIGEFDRKIERLKLIMARHHQTVKKIYDYCQGLGVGDIWAMSGGGCQLQVFFGNKTGYLAILYLDMDNSPMGKLYASDEGDDERVWTLQVQSTKNDPLFANMNIKGVNVRTCFEVYGAGY